MTRLGKDRWEAERPTYACLRLARDGDEVERAVANHPDAAGRFDHFEAFWRFHVCPARTGPGDVRTRARADPVVHNIAQKSYGVARDLAIALVHLDRVRAGDLGVLYENVDITTKFAGDAAQVATDLQNAITPRGDSSRGVMSLAERLRIRLDPFPDWAEEGWGGRREEVVRCRNYLTHEGAVPRVWADRGRPFLVPSRRAMCRRWDQLWEEPTKDYKRHPADWIPVAVACESAVRDMVGFIDDFFGRLCGTLDPLLEAPAYQGLWGWADAP